MPAAQPTIILQHFPVWACRPLYDKDHDLLYPLSFLMPFFVVSAPVVPFTPVIMSFMSPKTSPKGYKHQH
jgi:hypothetical protein